MPNTAVKVSDEFADVARKAAHAADRSMAGQIEHWAKLGSSLEALVPTPIANAIKASKGDLEAIEDQGLREQVIAAVERFQVLQGPEKRRLLGLDSKPIFEPDPDHPGGFIRVDPSGARVPGTLQGREFVPSS